MAKVPVAVRMDEEIRDAGHRRAEADRRSFTAYLEWLIQEDVARRPVEGAVAAKRLPRKAKP